MLFFKILLSKISQSYSEYRIVWQEWLFGLFVSLIHNHFSNLSIGSLSDHLIFQICTLTYFFINTTFILTFAAHPARKQRHIRSSISDIFTPGVKTNIGSRYFPVAAPTLGNLLPDNVQSAGSLLSFRHHWKTHLLYLAYLHSTPAECNFVHACILFPLLCGVDVRRYTTPCSSVIHFIPQQQSLLFDITPHSIQPSSLPSPVYFNFHRPFFLHSALFFASHHVTCAYLFNLRSWTFFDICPTFVAHDSFISYPVKLSNSTHPS